MYEVMLSDWKRWSKREKNATNQNGRSQQACLQKNGKSTKISTVRNNGENTDTTLTWTSILTLFHIKPTKIFVLDDVVIVENLSGHNLDCSQLICRLLRRSGDGYLTMSGKQEEICLKSHCFLNWSVLSWKIQWNNITDIQTIIKKKKLYNQWIIHDWFNIYCTRDNTFVFWWATSEPRSKT